MTRRRPARARLKGLSSWSCLRTREDLARELRDAPVLEEPAR